MGALRRRLRGQLQGPPFLIVHSHPAHAWHDVVECTQEIALSAKPDLLPQFFLAERMSFQESFGRTRIHPMISGKCPAETHCCPQHGRARLSRYFWPCRRIDMRRIGSHARCVLWLCSPDARRAGSSWGGGALPLGSAPRSRSDALGAFVGGGLWVPRPTRSTAKLSDKKVVFGD